MPPSVNTPPEPSFPPPQRPSLYYTVLFGERKRRAIAELAVAVAEQLNHGRQAGRQAGRQEGRKAGRPGGRAERDLIAFSRQTQKVRGGRRTEHREQSRAGREKEAEMNDETEGRWRFRPPA